ncbi:MAG TPA: shikimate kinase [Acidimicrobiia bacterium]
MGVGKTTVGRMLAVEIGLPFLDSDEYLEADRGEPGSAIAARGGVASLHELELEAFLAMCQTPGTAVIAPAASVVDHEPGRRALEENYTVWLTAPEEVLAERQGKGTHRRPISPEAHAALQAARAPFLSEVSAVTIDTGTSSAMEVVEKLVEILPESLFADEN